MSENNDLRLRGTSEKMVQCWVRRVNRPDVWEQMSGGRKSEYPSIKAFKAAARKSTSGAYGKLFFDDLAYNNILEVSWVEVEKTLSKRIITE